MEDCDGLTSCCLTKSPFCGEICVVPNQPEAPVEPCHVTYRNRRVAKIISCTTCWINFSVDVKLYISINQVFINAFKALVSAFMP